MQNMPAFSKPKDCDSRGGIFTMFTENIAMCVWQVHGLDYDTQ